MSSETAELQTEMEKIKEANGKRMKIYSLTTCLSSFVMLVLFGVSFYNFPISNILTACVAAVSLVIKLCLEIYKYWLKKQLNKTIRAIQQLLISRVKENFLQNHDQYLEGLVDMCLQEKTVKVKVNDTEVKVNDTEVKVNDTEVKVNDTGVKVNDTEVKVNDTEVKEKENEKTKKTRCQEDCCCC